MHELLTVHGQRKSKQYHLSTDIKIVCPFGHFTQGLKYRELYECFMLFIHLFKLECISMATLVCAHGPTILTNHEPSKLVAECIFCVSQIMIWIIIYIVYIVQVPFKHLFLRVKISA